MAKNNFSRFINLVAFVGLMVIAVVLILQKLNLQGNVIQALRTIGECVAYSITAISAFFYVRSKRQVWWYVAYAVAVVLVIVFIILR